MYYPEQKRRNIQPVKWGTLQYEDLLSHYWCCVGKRQQILGQIPKVLAGGQPERSTGPSAEWSL